MFQTVVIDPGHGAADTGARGANGMIEKDLVLAWAKRLRSELQSRLSLTVLLTRDRDVGPTLDERAAVANASHADLFLSLHVATKGLARTAQVYTWQANPSAATGEAASVPARLIAWESAQRRSLEESQRFAELLQRELARGLPDSVAKSGQAPVRVLRSVMGPAVAIEVSSVSVQARELAGIDQSLVTAIAAAIQAFKPSYERAAIAKPPPVETSRDSAPSGASVPAKAQADKSEATKP